VAQLAAEADETCERPDDRDAGSTRNLASVGLAAYRRKRQFWGHLRQGMPRWEIRRHREADRAAAICV